MPGGQQSSVREQEALLSKPLYNAVKGFLIRGAEGVKVYAAGKVAQRAGGRGLYLFTEGVCVKTGEYVKWCANLAINGVLYGNVDERPAQIYDSVKLFPDKACIVAAHYASIQVSGRVLQHIAPRRCENTKPACP